MHNHLSDLLSPITAEDFFEKFWGRQYLHVARSSYRESILRIEDLDLFLQSEQRPAAFFNVVRNGEPVPDQEWSRLARAARGEVRVAVPERVLEYYRKGATIILNQAHHALPALSEACRDLTGELGFPVHANVYATPPNAQGFLRHSDDHEIFILAVFGGKSFSLHTDGAAKVEIDLRAGDLLYLPRGLAHEAKCTTTASVHVSIGLKPVYAFQMVEELAALARQSPEFQQMAPLGSASETAWVDFQEQLIERMRALMARTPAAALASRRFRAQADSQITGWPDRFSDLLRIADATPDTVLVARGNVATWIEEDGANLQVCFGGTRLTVPKFLRPALDRALDGTPFKIAEIPGMISEQGRMEMAKSLVEAGILTFEGRTNQVGI